MTWTFVKHERQNAKNAAAKRDGKRLVYDFFVLRDGEHVAWWLRSSNHYYLADLFHEAILQPPSGRGACVAIRAPSQAKFAAVLDKHADKIPTMAELVKRREDRKAKLERANAKEAHDQLANPQHYL